MGKRRFGAEEGNSGNPTLAADGHTVAGDYHLKVTALAMVWSVGVLALYLALSRRLAPPALKYAVTAWDLVLATALLVLSGGPGSPLVVLYFLVIAAAPLRLSLGLVYTATLGSVVAYAFLVGHHAFYTVGRERYYARPELLSLLIDRTPTAHIHDRGAHPVVGADHGSEIL